MEKTSENKERLYLEEATLSGYKSVYNTSVTFKKGLNIIIGKNAVGKTNFLSFLYRVLNFSYHNLFEFKSILTLKNGKKIVATAENKIRSEIPDKLNVVINNKIISKIYIGDDLQIEAQDLSPELRIELYSKDILLNTTFITHGIPKLFPFVSEPFSMSSHGNSNELLSLAITHPEVPYFIRSVSISLFLSNFKKSNWETGPTYDEARQNLSETFNFINFLNPYLQKITPIEEIRFNENYNIFLEDKKGYTVNNLFIEFKVDGNWHPFSNLSDGTKRLFYIISEVAFESPFYSIPSGIADLEPNNINRIILIEEPELGIHPHQLHQLMLFLKEQSRNKQIIITTHSPEVLDILDKDELDNIIIASYEKGKGTLMRHLDDKEIYKAKKYMEDEYLSDYWRFSDLEKQE